MNCPLHGAMLAYGSFEKDGKEYYTWRCMDGATILHYDKLENNGISGRKNPPVEYRQIKKCETVLEK